VDQPPWYINPKDSHLQRISFFKVENPKYIMKAWLYLVQILQHSSAQLWSSSRLVAQGNLEESEDGIHLGPLALKHDTQVS
jgi:hypothetical protein